MWSFAVDSISSWVASVPWSWPLGCPEQRGKEVKRRNVTYFKEISPLEIIIYHWQTGIQDVMAWKFHLSVKKKKNFITWAIQPVMWIMWCLFQTKLQTCIIGKVMQIYVMWWCGLLHILYLKLWLELKQYSNLISWLVTAQNKHTYL